MTIRSLARLALAGSAFAFLATSAMADGIGASLLTQQHPFYIELADAMKAEATALTSCSGTLLEAISARS